jgi:hypothetical protein
VGVAEGCAHIFALGSDKTARVLKDSKGWDVRQQLSRRDGSGTPGTFPTVIGN